MSRDRGPAGSIPADAAPRSQAPGETDQGAASVAPELSGPYSAWVYGRCADGHPVNLVGRCEPLNHTDSDRWTGGDRKDAS